MRKIKQSDPTAVKAISEEKPDYSDLWWTTEEVAKAIGRSADAVRMAAKRMYLFGEAKRGVKRKYTLTDVLMIRKDIEKNKKERVKRDHKEEALKLKRILAEYDRGDA